MKPDPAFEPLAEDALLVRWGDGIDAATNARVHAAAQAIRAAGLPGITDIAPAYATLLLRFDPSTWLDPPAARPFERIEASVRSTIGAALGSPRRPRPHPALSPDPEAVGPGGLEGVAAHGVLEIPVCYGGNCGPDLARVATHAGLAPDDVIARHAGGEYMVAMLGFAPGFPYLLGLDPALATPRRADPRTRVPAGSIAIGGAQTGIYPRQLPGGWNLIGRTPLPLFDPLREPPCLLAPGDRVRFRPIDAGDFARRAKGAD